MGEVIRMSGNMEQRDSRAREILGRLSLLVPLPTYAPDETVLIQEILEGRAVTTGRLAMLEEIESKYTKEKRA